MFKPNFEISNKLLQNLKKISNLAAELKHRSISSNSYLEFRKSAMALSSFSSTSIEGNPLPLSEVKKIINKNPKILRDSEREILNYNEALNYIHNLMERESMTIVP